MCDEYEYRCGFVNTHDYDDYSYEDRCDLISTELLSKGLSLQGAFEDYGDYAIPIDHSNMWWEHSFDYEPTKGIRLNVTMQYRGIHIPMTVRDIWIGSCNNRQHPRGQCYAKITLDTDEFNSLKEAEDAITEYISQHLDELLAKIYTTLYSIDWKLNKSSDRIGFSEGRYQMSVIWTSVEPIRAYRAELILRGTRFDVTPFINGSYSHISANQFGDYVLNTETYQQALCNYIKYANCDETEAFEPILAYNVVNSAIPKDCADPIKIYGVFIYGKSYVRTSLYKIALITLESRQGMFLSEIRVLDSHGNCRYCLQLHKSKIKLRPQGNMNTVPIGKWKVWNELVRVLKQRSGPNTPEFCELKTIIDTSSWKAE